MALRKRSIIELLIFLWRVLYIYIVVTIIFHRVTINHIEFGSGVIGFYA